MRYTFSLWLHFWKTLLFAGAVGDTLGSVVYVPCEVMTQCMQVHETYSSWSSIAMNDGIAMNSSKKLYGYYIGMFHAGCSIWRTQGLKCLYAGYFFTLARDVPFAGLMVLFYRVKYTFCP
ncbi:uncharacterized mitochondrial carrier C1442.03-like isoform X2 [Arachis ipaensis]|uniref:uncharacterized mitochondrial carrier C1442.03-like isoform X2 n=1 Tax=Arachis ipaensis TaxID=130454 RepID=UPI000A2B4D91|nr:uncharacterized mitochondrial carrier C1442.03-like isoform X2 [Arachis ipaensis]